MSLNPHEVELEVLITVKAYPTPSMKYSESVCVAGIRLDTPTPEWVRLYPVLFRDLPKSRQFDKYDILRLRGRPRTGDPQPESFSPNLDTIEKIDHISAEHDWRDRIPHIDAVRIGSMCELYRREKADRTSLGVFRPAEITRLEITATSAEWDQKRQSALGQGSLFCEEQKRPLEKIPFEFHFSFRCDDPTCNGHRMSMIDWQIGEHYRKTRRAGRSLDERLRLVEERWIGLVYGPNRDTQFFAGNMAKRHNTFVLLGAFWPPKQAVAAPQEPALF
jgi:hypothetical protein